LPSAPEDAQNSEGDRSADATASGEHVLVVDDEPDVARLLERLLVGRGYRVTSFTSSEEALSAFRSEPESFHAVITDHTMPRLTGVDLARKVKSLRADIPVILTTGYGDGISAAPAGSDVDAVAGKPLDAAGLTETLRRLIAAE
jgi:CheY-like chemotaxis protein